MGLLIFLAYSTVYSVPLLFSPAKKASNTSQASTISLLRSKYHRGWYFIVASVLKAGRYTLHCIPCFLAMPSAMVSAPAAPPVKSKLGFISSMACSMQSVSVNFLLPVIPIIILSYPYLAPRLYTWAFTLCHGRYHITSVVLYAFSTMHLPKLVHAKHFVVVFLVCIFMVVPCFFIPGKFHASFF